MVDWDQVRSLARETKRLEKLVKGYSYADRDQSVITDEKVCHLITSGIHEAKQKLFNFIDLFYSIEKKAPVSKHMQRLKDELDIFSDEVKARYCDWNDLDDKWTVKMVKRDDLLLKGMDKLNADLQRLYELVLADKALLSDSKRGDERLWRIIKTQLHDIEELIDDLVTLFKEREGICNLRPLSLEKTFQSIQERIERQI